MVAQAVAWTMMSGSPDEVLRDMGNRIVELERLAILSDQRERELRNITEELGRGMASGTRGDTKWEKTHPKVKRCWG